MPSRRKLLITGLAITATVLAVAAWTWARPAPAPLVGMVRTTEIRIAPEVSGRLAKFLVEPGAQVEAGQPVALLVNPELWAAVDTAGGVVEKAKSDRDRVYAGVREEQVQSLQREIVKAEAVHGDAVQNLARKSSLALRSDASLQALDEARAEQARDAAQIAVARARYEEAKHGPTPAERALADATVAASEAARAVVEARGAKMLVRAPVAGTVALHVAEVGEAVVPGEPLLTMVPKEGVWFAFNVREDALSGLAMGSVVRVHATGMAAPVSAKVVELRNWGEFATWRAARATGDRDLNTFFVRLDPVSAAPGLAPGQTVWLDRSRGSDQIGCGLCLRSVRLGGGDHRWTDLVLYVVAHTARSASRQASGERES